MRQTMTAELRLDEGKATSSGAARPSDSLFWPPTGRLRSNFVVARRAETENRAQRLRYPENVGLNHQPDTADPPPRTRPPSLSMATTRSVAEPSDIIGHWPFFSAKQKWW